MASRRHRSRQYQVVNRTSELALAVANASTADGVLINQESTSTPSAQRWTLSKIN
ncbi:RICIN domain-containing protein [Streptomyces variegatus]|uniref:RICIN domain-containing protein n=1 Tax=Streptomyces variegatus TaxID=284040 RepID=UPI003C2F5E11